MKKISNFLGSQVINLAAAKAEGVIINGIMDDKLKKMYYYVLVNEETFEDEELFLPLSSVIEGADTLYITSNRQVNSINEQFIKCPLNARVFNTDGELLGKVKDIEYDEKGYTQSIVCDSGNIAQHEIVLASSSLITVKGNKQIRVQRKKTNPQRIKVEEMMNIPENIENTSLDNTAKDTDSTNIKNDIPLKDTSNTNIKNDILFKDTKSTDTQSSRDINIVDIKNTSTKDNATRTANVENASKSIQDAVQQKKDCENNVFFSERIEYPTPIAATNEFATKEPQKENNELPPRIISNYNFLLSRKVTKDICSQTNDIIIAKDSVIDDEVVKIARKHGKLVELTINSK